MLTLNDYSISLDWKWETLVVQINVYLFKHVLPTFLILRVSLLPVASVRISLWWQTTFIGQSLNPHEELFISLISFPHLLCTYTVLRCNRKVVHFFSFFCRQPSKCEVLVETGPTKVLTYYVLTVFMSKLLLCWKKRCCISLHTVNSVNDTPKWLSSAPLPFT